MATSYPTSLKYRLYKDTNCAITIEELIHCVRNQDYRDYTVGNTRVVPHGAYRGDKNYSHITNSANPHGFYLYGDGDIRLPSELEDILPSLPVADQDRWMINTFGVFRN